MTKIKSEHIDELYLKAAREISYNLATGHVGDSLNLVNLCTTYRYFVGKNDEATSLLFGLLQNLPSSHGADFIFDITLRYSSAVLLGRDDYKYPGFKKTRSIEYLVDFWKLKPRVYSFNWFLILIFAQYLTRLIDEGYSVEREVRLAISYQLLGEYSTVLNAKDNKEHIIIILDKTLFTALVSERLGVKVVSNIFLEESIKISEILVQTYLDSEPKTRFGGILF